MGGILLKGKKSASKKRNDNKQKPDKLMPASQIALLEILSEGPANGKIILEILKNRGYENWVNMKKSAMYKSLGVLEKKGYIIGEREEDYKTSKKTYSITQKGSEKVIEQVKLCIIEAPPVKSVFDLGIAGLSYLTKSEAIAILEQYKLDQGFVIKWFEDTLYDLDNLHKLVEIIPDKWVAGNTIKGHFENKGINFIVRALFDRPYRIIKTQIQWLEEFIQSIKEDKGEFYFKEE